MITYGCSRDHIRLQASLSQLFNLLLAFGLLRCCGIGRSSAVHYIVHYIVHYLVH